MADDKDKKVVGGISGFSIIIGLMVLFSFWLTTHGPGAVNDISKSASSTPTTQSQKTSVTKTASTKTSNSQTTTNKDEEKNISPYKGKITLRSGTAKSTYQPRQEYIIISARGNDEPINIGGWTLKNGRDKQLQTISGNTVRLQSTIVRIPSSGVALYNPYYPQNNRQVPITLKSGERAIITTGGSPVLRGVTVKDNFKLNRCLGYLEDGSGYRAYPKLSYKCPASKDVPGISYLDDTCYDFARSIRACHTPEDVYVKDEGNCLDKNCKLTSYCRSFIKENYNFNACFSRYSGDEDFVGPEWRIFLNQNFELWADRRETISLYDTKGLLVDEISY